MYFKSEAGPVACKLLEITCDWNTSHEFGPQFYNAKIEVTDKGHPTYRKGEILELGSHHVNKTVESYRDIGVSLHLLIKQGDLQEYIKT
jgi:hypothetical protein